PQALLAQASAAMAHARERGNGVPQFFRPELAARAERTVRLEAELQQALARDEFCLLLQPRYAIASRRLTGAEALLRWRHPRRGLLAPEDFLDVAQASGLIVPIGARVLALACRQAARWTAALPVAVNLSPREFGGASIVPAVARALNEAGLPASRLQVEIDAASLLAPEAERAADTVLRLQEAGVQVLLDRAGAEAPAALRVAPFDGVKLDGALLRAAVADARTAQVAIALARLARRLGARTIAAGVETPAQLAFARRAGCTEAQGFLLGAPAAPEDFAASIARAPRRRRRGTQQPAVVTVTS
ncbi:MAG: EAL domain-containing protein, partial [Burkholderiaceae bacterium]|nr:EAL domain-containing protein [Burkholderiaceae bacterium]